MFAIHTRRLRKRSLFQTRSGCWLRVIRLKETERMTTHKGKVASLLAQRPLRAATLLNLRDFTAVLAAVGFSLHALHEDGALARLVGDCVHLT